MRDLAAYIMDLAELLGSHESVHCQEIRDGSTVLVIERLGETIPPVSPRNFHRRRAGQVPPASEPTSRALVVPSFL